MRPEPAAGAREAQGCVGHCRRMVPGYHCFRSGPRAKHHGDLGSGPPQDAEPTRTGGELELGSDQQTFGSKGASGFQHPVKTFYPFLSIKSICRVRARRCWLVSLCKPPFTSAAMSQIQMRSKRKKPFSARRLEAAQEERAERLTNPGDNGNPETMAASLVRVCSPALTLRGWCVTLIQISLSLPHQTHLTCALGDSPWGQPCQDTLRFLWVYKNLTVSGQHPTLGKDSAFTRPSPGDFLSLIYTSEKGF